MNALIHYRYWTNTDRTDLENAGSFGQLAEIAIEIMSRWPCAVEMVSGPISTGGVGSIDGNRKVFEKVIEALCATERLAVFSQMPFEDKMVDLYKKWHTENPDEKYCMPILTDFYERVFSSGKVTRLNFINDWQSSFGARWEHDGCGRWKIVRRYLPRELSERVLVTS